MGLFLKNHNSIFLESLIVENAKKKLTKVKERNRKKERLMALFYAVLNKEKNEENIKICRNLTV